MIVKFLLYKLLMILIKETMIKKGTNSLVKLTSRLKACPITHNIIDRYKNVITNGHMLYS